MKKFWNRIIATLAIGGLVISMTSPALAAVEYDPNDPYFDPSGTYVPPVQEVVVADAPADELPIAGPIDGTEVTVDAAAPQVVEDITSASVDDSVIENPSDDQIASNEETGAFSDNEAIINTENEHETDITNEADINNQVDAEADSGNNDANFNTGDGSVETGDADLATNLITIANSLLNGSNSFALPLINIFDSLTGDLVFDTAGQQALTVQDNTGLSQIASNFQTGANSDNTSVINQDNSSDTRLNNQGEINNNLVLGANTGQNNANGNTGDGTVETGNANLAANVVNFLNTTVLSEDWWMGMVNIFGDWNGNLVLPSLLGGSNSGAGNSDLLATNQLTGAHSLNDAIINNNAENTVLIDNDATVVNEIDATANTGLNDASFNTGNGTVQTGDANVNGNVANIVNTTVVGSQWWMVLVNTLDGIAGAIIGAPDGTTTFQPFDTDIAAANEETGFNSDNQAIVNNNEQATLDIKNEGTVGNKLTLDANTGENNANYNTGSGDVKTGDANIMANLVNFVNNTFDVDKWMFGVVNVFGHWDGKIKFAGDTGPEIDTAILAGGNVTAANEDTGAFSDNLAEINSSNQTNLIINNKAKLRKKVDIIAETGKNHADYNTGCGKIITGNANVKFNELEIVNQVIIAKEKKEVIEEEEIIEEVISPPTQVSEIPSVSASSSWLNFFSFLNSFNFS